MRRSVRRAPIVPKQVGDYEKVAFPHRDVISSLQRRVEDLQDVLRQLSAPFHLGNNERVVNFETLAREFNRRQRIAARALNEEPCGRST
jgi:hypothetical protein